METPKRPSSIEEVESITDIQFLYDIALGEPDRTIQNAAIEKLNAMKDEKLESIDVYEWRKWTYDESDEPAMDECWYGSEIYKDSPDVRMDAVAKLTKQRIIEMIGHKDPCTSVGTSAINKLTDATYLNLMRKYDRISKFMQEKYERRLSSLLNTPIEKLDDVMKGDLLNIFDESYKWVGVMPRSIAHRDGLWHETFHCWFMQRERLDGRETAYLWFQKRSADKKDYPNLLDITSAGHLDYREKPSGGIREIEEELGINVPVEELRDLGIRINVEKTPKLFNNEFNHVFLYDCPNTMDQIRFADGEVEGIYRINVEDGIKLFRGEVEQIAAEGYACFDDQQVAASLIVDSTFFVPRPVDAYYLKMCIIADQAAKGYPYAAI